MISAGTMEHGALEMKAPDLTDIIFNDAYRYMVWLSTVPWLLSKILLVMKLDEVTLNSKVWVLGVNSALMIASSYYSDLVGTCGYNSDHDGLALRTIACCIDYW